MYTKYNLKYDAVRYNKLIEKQKYNNDGYCEKFKTLMYST